MSTKTGLFILTACAPLYATTPQEDFLNSLYIPGKYSTTIEIAGNLPGITPSDSTILQQSWMCLPSGLDASSVVLTSLPEALRSQVDAIANAGSFLALKLQGYGDNQVETTASLAALKEGASTETDSTKKAALERAHDFAQLIHDIDTALKTHIDTQKTKKVNDKVNNVVQNIIKLVGGEENLNLYLNFKDAVALKAYVKAQITDKKAN